MSEIQYPQSLGEDCLGVGERTLRIIAMGLPDDSEFKRVVCGRIRDRMMEARIWMWHRNKP